MLKKKKKNINKQTKQNKNKNGTRFESVTDDSYLQDPAMADSFVAAKWIFFSPCKTLSRFWQL